MSNICNVPFCLSPKYFGGSKLRPYCNTHICEMKKYKYKAYKELLPLWAFKRCKIHGLLNYDQTYIYHRISQKYTVIQCKKCTKKYINSLYDPVTNAIVTKRRRAQKKERELKCVYGLTSQELDTFLQSQDNKCSICLMSFDEFTRTKFGKKMRSFDLDHCHKTGKFRGLLCHRCNIFIGLAKDSIDNLKRAIDYLS